MIGTLFVALIVLAIGVWITVMYMWWQKENHIVEKPIHLTDTMLHYWEKSERLARRGWYHTLLFGKQTFQWSNKKVGAIFFTLFPNAEPAFAKRNSLIGLEQGPSSYFLMSISEQEQKKPLARRRKIV
jgi:hypothetical protein